MNTLHTIQSNKGFSLVELMVAILLLVVGVLAALSMVSTAIKQNTLAHRLSVKTALGQEVMEDLLSKKVDDPQVNTSKSSDYDLNGPNVAGTDLLVQGAGTYHATYTTTVNTPSTGITQIKVEISSVSLPGDPPLKLTCFKRVQ